MVLVMVLIMVLVMVLVPVLVLVVLPQSTLATTLDGSYTAPAALTAALNTSMIPSVDNTC